MSQKKQESYGGWGVFVLVTITFFLLAISLVIILVSSPAKPIDNYNNLYNEYLTQVNSYNSLRDEFTNAINSCEASPEKCLLILGVSKSGIPEQPTRPIEKENLPIWLPIWLQYGNIILVSIFGFCAILITSIQVYQSRQRSLLREKQFERERQQAVEDGRREIIKSLALELVTDKDVISELAVWLTEYKSGSAKIDQSARIHNQLLTRLMKQIHLNPILKFNETVSFDPNQHHTYDRLRPAEEAIVIEPGWRVGREVIKLPLVRRKS